MCRLRILQLWMATVVLSSGLAVVPGMAAGNTQTLPERLAMPCVLSTWRGDRPISANLRIASCLPGTRAQSPMR
jgi:hypothetical protein